MRADTMEIDYKVDILPVFCISIIHFMSGDAQRFFLLDLYSELFQTKKRVITSHNWHLKIFMTIYYID